MRNTPYVGMQGIFVVRAPFVLDLGDVWTVNAVRSFNDIYKSGNDVYVKYYEPYGLAAGVFEADVVEQANIVTFVNEDGAFVYVPDTYINELPSRDTVDYASMVLAIGLGGLPVSTDLTFLIDEVTQITASFLGLVADVEVCVVSEPGKISAADHAVNIANRSGLLDTSTTIYAQKIQLEEMLVLKNQEIAALKRYISDNITPP